MAYSSPTTHLKFLGHWNKRDMVGPVIIISISAEKECQLCKSLPNHSDISVERHCKQVGMVPQMPCHCAGCPSRHLWHPSMQKLATGKQQITMIYRRHTDFCIDTDLRHFHAILSNYMGASKCLLIAVRKYLGENWRGALSKSLRSQAHNFFCMYLKYSRTPL